MANLSDLTPREKEILKRVIAGKTNKAIASEIFISERTVEFHLDHIYTKIGARSRMLARFWAMEHGIRARAVEIPS